MKTHKTEIKLTPEQINKLARTFGVCRFVYGLYLSTNKERYERGEKFLSGFDFSRYLNNEYRDENPDKAWIQEVSCKAVKEAIMNAEKAFKAFFEGRAGYPRFKSKHSTKQSCYLCGTIHVQRHRIQLPTLGWVRLKEFGYIPPGKTPSSCTISFEGGKYLVSALERKIESPEPAPATGEGLGVDIGVRTFAIVSDGRTFENINKTPAMRKAVRRMKREQRKYARKLHKGRITERRANRKKQKMKLARAHYRIACIRKNHVKHVVSRLVKTKPAFIAIEDLNVRGMMKNRHLSRAIAEQNFSYFRTFLEAKCRSLGIFLAVSNRFFPSSKTCSHCGTVKKDLRLSDRTYVCSACGMVVDRDINAAMNLKDCGSLLYSHALSTAG